jgi:hypothetical protein
MQQVTGKEFAFIATALVLLSYVREIVSWRRLRRWGKQFGAGNMPTMPNYLPGGIERYSILFTDLKSTVYQSINGNIRPDGI